MIVLDPTIHKRVLCFDTETSGLIPRRLPNGDYPPDEAYPYILQISWIVYNTYTTQLEEVVNEYVRIPADMHLSEEALKVNNITREMLDIHGKPIEQVLLKFFNAYMRCNCVVGHNLWFDKSMVRKEMRRNRETMRRLLGGGDNETTISQMMRILTDDLNASLGITAYCTMMNSLQLSKPVESSGSGGCISISPPPRYKYLKLGELFQILFHTSPPSNLHNSLIDVLVCLRCFLVLANFKEMSEKYFLRLIDEYNVASSIASKIASQHSLPAATNIHMILVDE